MAKWEKGALNEVSIEGILSEVKLQEGTGKNNEPVIFGEYKIKTTNTIDGVETVCEIPIRVYQSKITKNKKENPAYNTALTIMKDYVSIAAGGEEKATCVRLSENSTSLQENFFLSKTTNNMVFSSGIRASFVNKINKENMTPGARFKAVVVIGDLIDEINKDGEETGRLILKGILPQWGGRVDVIDFVVSNKKVIEHIRNNWEKGNTVLIGGYINYSSTVKTVTEENTFGEPMISKSTQSVREYVITGGHEEPLTEEEGAYSPEDIAEALQERQQRIEKAKEKNKETESKPSHISFGF